MIRHEIDPHQPPCERAARDRLSRASRCGRGRNWMVLTTTDPRYAASGRRNRCAARVDGGLGIG